MMMAIVLLTNGPPRRLLPLLREQLCIWFFSRIIQRQIILYVLKKIEITTLHFIDIFRGVADKAYLFRPKISVI